MLRRVRRGLAKSYLLSRKVWAKVAPPTPAKALPTPAAPVSLDGLVVVVTGATGGIGAALARGFAEAGCHVVINGRHQSELVRTAEQIAGMVSDVLTVRADVSEAIGAERLIDDAVKRFGKVDVLINNAAVSDPDGRRVWDLALDEWQAVIASNLTGPFMCARALIGWAKKSGLPVRIVNVSSGIVGNGAPHLGAYCATKSGLEGLTYAIAADALDDGIDVGVVTLRPRSVRSRLTDNYFDTAEYALMDEPAVLVPAFLYAATAPIADIMGRTINEPAFAADPLGERVLNGDLAVSGALRFMPDTYNPSLTKPNIENPAEYMHFLENAIGVYPEVARTLGRRIQERKSYSYPDPAYRELKMALSARFDLPIESFAIGPGSSDLLFRIFDAFAGPSENIVLTKPTWSMVVGWLMNRGIHFLQVPMIGGLESKDMRHDLDGILHAINSRTRLVYLVNPCNPTGSTLDRKAIESFLDALPEHVTLLLDEAYIEYGAPEYRVPFVDLIERTNARVIALRTFSKFFGLSGCRIGYAYGRPELIELIERTLPPFAVSQLSQMAAIAALGDTDAQKRTYDNNAAERTRIVAALDEMKIASMPSQTSFVLYDCPLDQDVMRADLHQSGIYMPNVSQFLQNYGLLAVGMPEHNQIILDYLSNY